MFRHSQLTLCMPVGVACKTLGFRVPPTTKKDLKKRFVELAKRHHPDQNQDEVEKATVQMVKLTEAYTTLKKLLDDGVQQRTSAAGAAAGGSSAVSSDAQNMEVVANSFRAPGSSLSLRGFTLPWQRYATTSAMADIDATLNRESTSFDAYVTGTRAKAKEWRRREERIEQDAPLSEGSHGFTADYFRRVHSMQDPLRDAQKDSDAAGSDAASTRSAQKGRASVDRFWASRWRTSMPYLACRFYGRRVRSWVSRAPRQAWETVRFIIHG